MSDYIMRSDVLTLVDKGYLISNSNYEKERKLINKLPDADVVEVVQSYDDCNTCGRKHCRYMPKPGEMVRINCPLWEEQEHESEDKE